jgi:hypothetical protein
VAVASSSSSNGLYKDLNGQLCRGKMNIKVNKYFG